METRKRGGFSRAQKRDEKKLLQSSSQGEPVSLDLPKSELAPVDPLKGEPVSVNLLEKQEVPVNDPLVDLRAKVQAGIIREVVIPTCFNLPGPNGENRTLTGNALLTVLNAVESLGIKFTFYLEDNVKDPAKLQAWKDTNKEFMDRCGGIKDIEEIRESDAWKSLRTQLETIMLSDTSFHTTLQTDVKNALGKHPEWKESTTYHIIATTVDCLFWHLPSAAENIGKAVSLWYASDFTKTATNARWKATKDFQRVAKSLVHYKYDVDKLNPLYQPAQLEHKKEETSPRQKEGSPAVADASVMESKQEGPSVWQSSTELPTSVSSSSSEAKTVTTTSTTLLKLARRDDASDNVSPRSREAVSVLHANRNEAAALPFDMNRVAVDCFKVYMQAYPGSAANFLAQYTTACSTIQHQSQHYSPPSSYRSQYRSPLYSPEGDASIDKKSRRSSERSQRHSPPSSPEGAPVEKISRPGSPPLDPLPAVAQPAPLSSTASGLSGWSMFATSATTAGTAANVIAQQRAQQQQSTSPVMVHASAPRHSN